jgi:anaerobic selenocysteine-containing dehydrogenase
MHNVPVLVSGRERCTLLVHPADAERTGVRAGARARITSAAGTIEAPVELSEDIAPGVVSLPHGWGHDRAGVRLGVAAAHPGVNNNLLAPATLVDVPSGNAVLNGIPVTIAPA